MKKFITLNSILLITFNIFSQNSPSYNISVNTRYGFIYPHRPSIEYLVSKHIWAFDINFLKQLNYQQWHKLYAYPYWGLGFYYADLGNPLYTGKAYAVYSILDLPLTQKKRKSFDLSISLGLAYITKYYDSKQNYYNVVVSSPLNAYVDFGLYQSLYLKHIRINYGLSFTHFSNGAVTKPNLGFNIPSIKLSVGLLKNHVFFIKDTSIKNLKPKHYELHLLLAAGIRQNNPSDPYYYFTNTLAFNIEKFFSQKRTHGLGIDVFHDPSIPQRYEFSYSNPYIPYFRIGIRFSNDLVINRFKLTFQTGIYLWDKYLLDGLIYSRVGIKYKVNKHLQANILLKAHFAKADVIEFGFSYYLVKDKLF